MNKVEIFYKKVIEAVCKECGTDPVMMFSNNKERNVDARGSGYNHTGRSQVERQYHIRSDWNDEASREPDAKPVPGQDKEELLSEKNGGERERGAIRYGLRVRYVVRHVICL